MISHEHRCIFIHIPKCAGTSVEMALGHHGERFSGAVDHRSMRMIERPYLSTACLADPSNVVELMRRGLYFLKHHHNPNNLATVTADQYRSYFKFTFVRNPWARAYSWYRNVIRFEPTRRRLRVDASTTLRAFLRRFAGKGGLRTQLSWLRDARGDIPLDFAGTVENIESDFDVVCRHLEIPRPRLQRMRNGKTEDYRDHFDPESIRLVAQAYAEEIDFFGYSFDSEGPARSPIAARTSPPPDETGLRDSVRRTVPR